MIYFIILGAFLFLIFYYDYCQNKQRRLFWYVVMMVMLILVAGLRYRIGVDSIRYENYYEDLHTLPNLKADDFKDTRYAPLYIILASACRTITSDFTLLQMVIAIIVNCTVFYFFYRNTPHIYLAATFYYICLYLNLNTEVIREALAVCVFLWAWPFFRKGQWLIYYLLCVVAFFCHVSSIVMLLLPLFWIPGIRWFFTFGRQTYFIVLALMAAGFLVQIYFFDFIKAIAFTENMAERAEVYKESDLGGNTLNIVGALGEVFKLMLYPFLALYFLNKGRSKQNLSSDTGLLKMEMMTLMSIYTAALTLGIAILSRYQNYFMFFAIATVSTCVFSELPGKGRKRYRIKFVMWVAVLLPLFAMQIYSLYFANFNKSGTLKNYMTYYPYSHRLDPQENPDRENVIRYSR